MVIKKQVLKLVNDSKLQKKFKDKCCHLVSYMIGKRAKSGLTQKQVAEKSGIPLKRIYYIEHGEDKDLRLGDIAAYLHAVGSSSKEYLRESGIQKTLLEKILNKFLHQHKWVETNRVKTQVNGFSEGASHYVVTIEFKCETCGDFKVEEYKIKP